MTDNEQDTFDLVVIGGGPVGENVAQYATEDTDLTVALVEGELVGGECSYYACMPSKALLRPVEIASAAGHLGGVHGARIDRAGLLERRDTWVSGYDDSGQVSWAQDLGMTIVRGHGRITGEREVTVRGSDGAERVLSARRAVVVATGSEAVIPQEYAGLHPWTSRDATGVVDVPGRLVIVGGGVVACEAATWIAALGSQVTMVVRGSRLLPSAEPFASAAVEKSLRQSGVDVLLDETVVSVTRDAPHDSGLGRVHGGPVHIETSGHGSIEADEVLVATGRKPRLADVGLESIGVDADQVLRRPDSLPDWLRVLGDASGEAPLTHWGKYRARVVGDEIAAAATGRARAYVPDDAPPVPQVVFTDPQVASVGLTESAARDQGLEVVVAHVELSAASGAGLLRDDASSHGEGATLVVDRATGRLVGATFVGPEMGELLHSATIAITGGVPVWVLRHAVPSYPTASELWLRLLEELPRELRSPL